MKKLFTLLAVALLVLTLGACKKEPVAPQAIVDEAAALIYEYNKPGEDNQVTSSFTRVALIDYEDYQMEVEWVVVGIEEEYVKVIPSTDGTEVTIEVNKYVDEDKEFTLQATVKSGENSKTVEFAYTMKAFVISDWAYWAANVTGVTMNIRGVIVAKDVYSNSYKNTSVYLQDLDGTHGYYAYGLACTQAQYTSELVVGNVIEVTGTTKMYNNFREFDKGCTYSLVKNAQDVVETREVTPVDITADVVAGNDLNQYQGNLVILKGFKVKQMNVATAFNETTQTGSMNVVIEKDGKEIITRMSTSNIFTYEALVATRDSLGIGYTVDVVGPMAWYNAPQVYALMEDGYVVKSTEVSAADKIAAELLTVEFESSYTEDANVTLPAAGTTYTDVTYAWVVKSGTANGVITDNVLALTMGEQTVEVVLELTATCGTEVVVEEYTIRLIVGEMTYAQIVDAAYALAAGTSLEGTYRLYGVVTAINTAYNPTYQNVTVTIQIGDKTDKLIQCYRMKGTGADAIVVGDDITVQGVLKNYNGTIEFDANCSFIGQGEIIDQSKIVTNAYALAAGESMPVQQVLTGVVTVVNTAYNPTYQNVTVTIVVDGLTEQPIQCYRLKGEGADTLAVDSVVTVVGTIKNYNGTIEFDSGCKIIPTADANQVRTLIAAYQLAAGESLEGTKQLTGLITVINTAYNATYQNITVTIVVNGFTEMPIQCYRLHGTGADALAVGNTITVSGILKNYNGTFEFDSGCDLIPAATN